jgi:23S rRNA pseudouridine2605 synthase
MEERLQKIMSHAGLGSRRACEELILAGRVTVNGRPAEIGQKADPAVDRIVVDGRAITAAEAPIYIALHKPRNVLSTVEAEPNDFRKTVRDLVPVEGHIYPVGRLDFDSEGLVLMTNDGDLANKLTHPRFGHQKIYRVLVARRPDDEQLSTWRRGVVLEDGYKTAPADVSIEVTAGKGCWLRVVMREGRKRQIREIGSLLGLPVVRILRIGIGPLRLGTLKPGEWRHLTAQEVAELKGQAAPARSPRPVHGQPQRTRRPAPSGEAPRRPARSSDKEPARRPARPGGEQAPRRPSRPSGGTSPRPGSGPKSPGAERKKSAPRR